MGAPRAIWRSASTRRLSNNFNAALNVDNRNSGARAGRGAAYEKLGAKPRRVR
jgi:hypothetical protein